MLGEAKKYFIIAYENRFKPLSVIPYKDIEISQLGVIIKYRLYNIKDGTEIVFENDELKNEVIGKQLMYITEGKVKKAVLEDIHIRDFIGVFINEKMELEVKIDKSTLEKLGFRLGYKIHKYLLEKDYNLDTQAPHNHHTVYEIPKEEFDTIIVKNYNKHFKKYTNSESEIRSCKFYEEDFI
jgi:hypothetical protein